MTITAAGLRRKGAMRLASSIDGERNHWKQHQRAIERAHYQLSVIRLNSTYIESVDDGFENRGMTALVGLAFGFGISYLFFLF